MPDNLYEQYIRARELQEWADYDRQRLEAEQAARLEKKRQDELDRRARAERIKRENRESDERFKATINRSNESMRGFDHWLEQTHEQDMKRLRSTRSFIQNSLDILNDLTDC